MADKFKQRHMDEQALDKVKYYVARNYFCHITALNCTIVWRSDVESTDEFTKWLIDVWFNANDKPIHLYCEVAYRIYEDVPEWYIDGYTHEAQDSVFLREPRIERYGV